MKINKTIKKLKLILFNNLHLKILSFFVALLMWINISSYLNAKYQIHGYIDVINIPSDIEVKSVKPEKVSVVLKGRKNVLNQSELTNISIYIDGKRLKEGKNVLSVQILLPSEKIKVVSIRPENVIIYARKINQNQPEEEIK
jgi:YbbR domain-containing protein